MEEPFLGGLVFCWCHSGQWEWGTQNGIEPNWILSMDGLFLGGFVKYFIFHIDEPILGGFGLFWYQSGQWESGTDHGIEPNIIYSMDGLFLGGFVKYFTFYLDEPILGGFGLMKLNQTWFIHGWAVLGRIWKIFHFLPRWAIFGRIWSL